MLGLGNLLTKSGVIKKFPNDFSFNFDGSNDYLEIDDNDGLDLTNFTLSAWIKLTDVSDFRAIISKRSSNDVNYSFFVTTSGANDGKLGSYDGSAEINSNATVNDGNWHHVAQVHNSGTTTFYIDGSASGSGSQSFSTNAHPVLIGEAGVGQGDKFLGNIDEVAIWDTALDATAIGKIGSKVVDLTKHSASNLKLWLRAGDKVLPESDASIARSDFYTDFDGTDDVVALGSDASLDNVFVGGATVMAWIKPSSDGENDFGRIFDKSDATDGTDGWHWLIQGESSSKVELRFGHAFSGSQPYWDSSLDVILNEWNHVAVTYDNSSNSNNPKFYINGISVAVAGGTAASGSADDDSSQNLFIGNNTGGDRSFAGAISTASIHKTILDAQTIKQFAKSRYTPMRDNRFSVVDFDGTDDYILVSDNDSLDQTTAITIITWAKHSTSTSDYDELVAKYTSTGSNNRSYAFAIDSNEKLVFTVSADGTDTVGSQTSDSALSTINEWHQYAVTFSSGTCKLFQDGVEIASTSSSLPSSIYAGASTLLIGAINTGGLSWAGQISSTSIYSTAKSAEEIYAIYQQGITYNESSESGLVGLWLMGDDTSKAYPTIADSSSNSNDGTMTSMESDDIVQQMISGYDMGAFESSSEELGGEEVVNGTFDSNTNSWDVYLASRGDLTWSSGRARIDNTTGTGNQFLRQTGQGRVFKQGVIYKVQFDHHVISEGSNGSSRLNFYWDSNQLIDVYDTTNKQGDTWTIYSVPNADKSHFLIGGFYLGDIYEIDNVTIKEVLQSSDLSDTFPAIIDVTEPVLGVELVGSGFYTLSNWVSSNTESNPTATSVKFVRGSDSQGGAIYLRSENNRLTTNLTVGEYYKITFTYTTDDADAYPAIKDSNNVYYSFGATSGEKVLYYKAVHATFDRIMFQGVSAGTFVQIADVSIKQVSGNVGTMTQMDGVSNLVYSSVLPDQSFLATGVNSAYNFIDLDGSNEYIQLTGNSPSGDFTISAWVKPERHGGTFNGIYTMWSGTNLWFGFKSHRTTGFLRIHTNAESNRRDTEDGTLANDVWQQVAVTVSNSTVKMFINGISKTLTNSAGTISGVTSASNPVIGGLSTSATSNALEGGISNIAVWDKALSDDAILDIYNGGRHYNLLDSYSDNMISYHTFGLLDASTGLSDSISTIYDRSGNSNHGTPTNADAGDLASSPNAEPNGYAKGDTNRSTTIP